MRYLKRLPLIALLLVVAPMAQAAPVLSFGIVPQQAATRLAREWGPLLAEVGRRAGVALRFSTAPDIPTFERRLAQGEYDFAYMNPYHYTVFHSGVGYTAFAHERGRSLVGIIVVAKDSPYRQLTDLKGQTVVFPAPAAFAASILTQAEFARQGLTIDSKYVISHDSAYRAVAAGLYQAGGGIGRTLEAAPPEIRAQLRVLTQTASYTPHPFTAHPRVAAEVVTRVAAALVSLADDEAGRQLLAPLSFAAIEPATDAEWDDVRSLGIDRLQQFAAPRP